MNKKSISCFTGGLFSSLTCRYKACYVPTRIILILAFCFASFITRAETGPQLVNTINAYGKGGGMGGVLQASWNSATATVTVTNSDGIPITGANTSLTLVIDLGVKVRWQASLTGSLYPPLITIDDLGSRFEVPTGGKIEQTGPGDGISHLNGSILVSGGKISATTGAAIRSESVTVIDGTVVSSGIYGTILATRVYIRGTGKVQAMGSNDAIRADDIVEVEDNAEVTATTGTAIRVHYTNCKVLVRGGVVKNSATSETKPAIHIENNTGNVTVSGTGKVQATGNGGYAILTGGNAEVKDNVEVSAAFGKAIEATGASSTVVVSGGIVKNSSISQTNPVIHISNADNTGLNVIISGGKVQATASGGYAVQTLGSVEISGNGEVSSTSGRSVNATGTGSKVTVSGNGKVLTAGGYAILTSGSTEVKDNATVSATTGTAINASGTSGTVTVSSGTVSSTTGRAISVTGSGSQVTVSGGVIKNSATSSYPVIYFSNINNTGLNITISGGRVEAASSGYAIQTYGSVVISGNAEISATTGRTIYVTGASSTVTVIGGKVSATTGNAIHSAGAGTVVSVIGGVVFAHGTAITGADNVINNSNFAGPTGTGVVIAWNQTAGKTSYYKGSSEDLAMQPAGCAKWNTLPGISCIAYNNGENSGYIEITGITVTAVPPVNAQVPVITTHPQSATAPMGTTRNLTVVATSSDGGTLSYQWHKNTSASNTGGTVISGATNANYAAPINTQGIFHYYVAVTNSITNNGDGGTKTAKATSNVATLTVTQPPVAVTGVSLDKPTLALIVGNTEQLTATIAPVNATDKTVTWTSSNTDVATVDVTGKVSAVTAGTANIKATANDGSGKEATCTVTVASGTTGVEDMDVIQFKAYPNPTDGRFMISFDREDTYRIVITDVAGKTLLHEMYTGRLKELDISRYSDGVYFVAVDNGKRQTVVKVVKKK